MPHDWQQGASDSVAPAKREPERERQDETPPRVEGVSPEGPPHAPDAQDLRVVNTDRLQLARYSATLADTLGVDGERDLHGPFRSGHGSTVASITPRGECE